MYEFISFNDEARDSDMFIIFIVKFLEEETFYTFEVSSISLDDEVSVSERVGLEVPAYRRNRAISVVVVASIGFLAAALVAVWWTRRKFCQPTPSDK